MPVRRGGLIIGGVGTILVVLEVWYLLGVDRTPLPQPVGAVANGSLVASSAPAPAPGPDPQGDFIAPVLADIENTWDALFTELGFPYEPLTLVRFSGLAQSACGFANAATGPFYCPGERKVYIDLEFIGALRERFPASGDSAEAYVIAHEVGHHVQKLMGTSETVRKLLQDASEDDAKTISLIAELQADCYAGIWANHSNRARHILEQGGIEEALAAVTAIGDDRLRQRARGYVMPDSFTHGTPEQRLRWFRTGLRQGDYLLSCETFATPDL